MRFSELVLAEQAKTWKFLELWVDPVLFPPKILMVVGDQDESCRIFSLQVAELA